MSYDIINAQVPVFFVHLGDFLLPLMKLSEATCEVLRSHI